MLFFSILKLIIYRNVLILLIDFWFFWYFLLFSIAMISTFYYCISFAYIKHACTPIVVFYLLPTIPRVVSLHQAPPQSTCPSGNLFLADASCSCNYQAVSLDGCGGSTGPSCSYCSLSAIGYSQIGPTNLASSMCQERN